MTLSLSTNCTILICPVCQNPLRLQEKYYACLNKHTFDIAKQGYVNLLLSHEKSSLAPGDSKEMVKSRVDFLNKAYYAPIAQSLYACIEKNLSINTPKMQHIADIGCGVGYYLADLKKQIDSKELGNARYIGIDISKEAVHCASRDYKAISWIVGSAVKLPFAPQSLDVLISVFSPLYIQQMHRVLSPEGQMIVVTPNENHLIELRQHLFDEIKEIDSDKLLDKTQSHFELIKETPLTYMAHLSSSADITNLLKMTPFYWRSTADKKAQLCALEALNVTIDVTLRTFNPKKL